jgi:hypothetical protein
MPCRLDLLHRWDLREENIIIRHQIEIEIEEGTRT